MSKTNVNVNIIRDTTPIACDKCKNQTFVNVLLMRRITALLSPNGRDGIVPVPTFACNACGHVNAEFVPAAPENEESTTQETEPTPPPSDKPKFEIVR